MIAASSNAQNIIIEATKKVDDFTKATSVSVTPKEEIVRGKKVIKETVNLSPMVKLMDPVARGTMSYYKGENGNEFFMISIFKTSDLGCMSQHNGKAMVMFEGGDVVELKQYSKTDCSDSASATYILVNKEVYGADDMESFLIAQSKTLEQIQNNKITKIRIYGTEYYSDIELRPEVQDIFQKMLAEIYTQLEN